MAVTPVGGASVMQGLLVVDESRRGCLGACFAGSAAEQSALVVYLPASKEHVRAQLEQVRGCTFRAGVCVSAVCNAQPGVGCVLLAPRAHCLRMQHRVVTHCAACIRPNLWQCSNPRARRRSRGL